MHRVALIADTHLTPATPAFGANLAAARDWIGERSIATTIHLGDITADGASDPTQLVYARSLLADWPGRLQTLPGNHDVGDNAAEGAHNVVSSQCLERYRAVFGADHWSQVIGNWTLIGLNAQLLARDEILQKEQDDWLRRVLDGVDGPVGLMLHKPLFRDGLTDTTRHHRYVPHEARAVLLKRFAGHDLRFIASGHTHQSRLHRVGEIEHVWVPSMAFVLPDALQETIGTKRVGMMLLTFDGDTPRFESVRPDAMVNHDLSDFPETYPTQARALRDIAAQRRG